MTFSLWNEKRGGLAVAPFSLCPTYSTGMITSFRRNGGGTIGAS